jgi:alkaline phosphatase D
MKPTGLESEELEDFGQVQATNVCHEVSSNPLEYLKDFPDRLAYKNSTHLPYPSSPIPFRTFPDPRLTTGNHFKFVVSSCMLPNFPYLPFNGDRIRGFDLLSDYIWSSDNGGLPHVITAAEPPDPVAEALPQVPVNDNTVSSEEAKSQEIPSTSGKVVTVDMNDSTSVSLPTPPPASVLPSDPSKAHTEFMMLLGDFVYAEVPWYGGNDIEMYRRLYRRTYGSPSFRKVYERLREYFTRI